MENKSNTGFTIMLIIAVLIIIGLTGYIVYDKVLDSKSNNITVKTSDNETNVTEDDTDEEEIVKELTKSEKDELVKNEVDELVKLLNTEMKDISNSCDYFGVNIINIKEDTDLLHTVAPYLMSCRYGLDYDKSGNMYLMTSKMYSKFQSYFNVEINNKKVVNGSMQYVAYEESSNYSDRFYDFQLDEQGITESNGVYSVIIDLFENSEFGCLVSKVELKISIKDNHVYYESFQVRDDLVEDLFN